MIKIIEDAICSYSKFVQFMSTTYEDMDGIKKIWNWVRRVNDTRAVVIAAMYGDKLIITEEYRVPLKGFEIGFPAGLVDENETPPEAAIRELKEETGLDVKEIYSVSPAIYNSAGLTNESIYLVVCSCTGSISQNLNEGSEDITTYIKSRKEVEELLQDETKMFGAKAWIMMKQFVDYGSLFERKSELENNLIDESKSLYE